MNMLYPWPEPVTAWSQLACSHAVYEWDIGSTNEMPRAMQLELGVKLLIQLCVEMNVWTKYRDH